jgi:6-phosphogluconolactonase
LKNQQVIERFPEIEAMSRAAAAKVVEIASESIQADKFFAMALSGGHTPQRLYEILAMEPFRRQIDWNHTRIFFSDERTVAPDRTESNYRMANEALLRHIPIRAGHVHRIGGEKKDKHAVAAAYQTEIATVFRVPPDGPPPAFHLVLLGLGEDGHTASLFPGSDALGEKKLWVAAHNVEAVAAWRITMTLPLINAAKNVVFLVSGQEKSTVLDEILTPTSDANVYPAQMIRPKKGKLFWFISESKEGK